MMDNSGKNEESLEVTSRNDMGDQQKSNQQDEDMIQMQQQSDNSQLQLSQKDESKVSEQNKPSFQIQMDDDEFSPIVIGQQQSSDAIQVNNSQEVKGHNSNSDSNILQLNKVEESPSKKDSAEKSMPNKGTIESQKQNLDTQIDLQEAMNQFFNTNNQKAEGINNAMDDSIILGGGVQDQQQLFQQIFAAQQNFPQFDNKNLNSMYFGALMNLNPQDPIMNQMGGAQGENLIATGGIPLNNKQKGTTSKKAKRERPSIHYCLNDFYDLRKIKYTLVFDELHKKQLQRSQIIYTLDLKDEAAIIPIVDAAIKDQHKRLYIDLGLHFKQMHIKEIAILDPEPRMEQNESNDSDEKPRFSKKSQINIPEESQFYGMMPSLGTAIIPDHCSDPVRKGFSQKSWYVTPRMQTSLFKNCFEAQKQFIQAQDVSKDLNTMDFYQKEFQYYSNKQYQIADKGEAAALLTENQPKSQMNLKKPEIHVAKFLSLKLKKQSPTEAIQSQLRKVLKILVSVGECDKDCSGQLTGQPEPLLDCGLRAISYKATQYQTNARDKNMGNGSESTQMSTYILTSDRFESSQLWLPQLFGTSRVPIGWSMNYLVPKDTQLISSGEFFGKRDISDKKSGTIKTLHTYKIKLTKIQKKQTLVDGADTNKQKSYKSVYLDGVIPDKIGFVLGEIPYLSIITDTASQSTNALGAAFFVSAKKQLIFESSNYLNDTVSQALDLMEKIIRKKHPSRQSFDYDSFKKTRQNLKLIFLPNLFQSKQEKQSLDFADNIHIMDEQIIFVQNVIEKRHKIHKILATSLAFDYFGSQVWEESQEDTWLLVSLRERIGDKFKKQRCGNNLYRYHLQKTIDKFVKAVQSGAERFSLTSKYVSHFSEIEIGEDIYHQKCQLIMHIIETMLGESNFSDVVRDIFSKASPTINLPLFKRILRNCTWFYDLQKNWVDFTSCPLIYCSRSYNKQKKNLTVTIQQHSASKQNIYLNQGFRNHKQDLDDQLCTNGQLLLNAIEANEINYFNLKGQQAEGVSAQSQQHNQSSLVNLNLETQQKFDVEVQRNAKRWFTNDIKLVIYTTDGGDIYKQEEKIKLKYPKTRIVRGIPIEKYLRKGIDRKKKDVNQAIIEVIKAQKVGERDRQGHQRKDGNSLLTDNDVLKFSEGFDLLGSRLLGRNADATKQLAEQLYQNQIDNNQWRLGTTEDEFEEYPDWISNKLFSVIQIESPVLWIRVDPDVEMIRRIKVVQSMKSWLYQLLQDRDFMGQIEACKELSQYHDKFVYKILERVATNEKYFFKVRKHALRSLQQLNVRAFYNYLSHEKTFLIFYYNQSNFNEKIGYYKSNDFSNVLEYFINMYMIRNLAKSKEKELPQKEDIVQLLGNSKKNLFVKFSNEAPNQQQSTKKAQNNQKTAQPCQSCPIFFESDFLLKDHRNINFDDQGNQVLNQKPNEQPAGKDEYDDRDFSFTTDNVCRLMIRLVKENDNSENPFDDSFYISKLLANLGKLDNFDFLVEICSIIDNKFNLDNIGQPSPQHCISKGAIKCFFNIRKQIFRYKSYKLPYLDAQKCIQELIRIENQLQVAEKSLNDTYAKFIEIQKDQTQPIELRSFIFEKDLKYRFMYHKEFIDQRFCQVENELNQNQMQDIVYGLNRTDSLKKKGASDIPLHKDISIPPKFLKPLYFTLKEIEESLSRNEFQYSTIQLKLLAQFLEKYFLTKLNFKECLKLDDKRCKIIAEKLTFLITESPLSALDRTISHWSKRIFNRIFFGSCPPIALARPPKQQDTIVCQAHFEIDPIWAECEDIQQQEADKQEINKQALANQKAKLQAEAKNEQQQQQKQDIEMQVQSAVTMPGVPPMGSTQFDLHNMTGLAAVQPTDPSVALFSNPFQAPVDGSFPMMYPGMQPNPQVQVQNPASLLEQNNFFAQMTGMGSNQAPPQNDVNSINFIGFDNKNIGINPQVPQKSSNNQNNEDIIRIGGSKNKNFININGVSSNKNRQSSANNQITVSLGQDQSQILIDNPEEAGGTTNRSNINLEITSYQEEDRTSRQINERESGYGNENDSYQSQRDRSRNSQVYRSVSDYNNAYNDDGNQRKNNNSGDDEEQMDINEGSINEEHYDDNRRHNEDIIEDENGNYTRVTWDQWHQQNQLHQEHEDDGDNQDMEIKEEVYDFDDYSFQEVWKQKCWDILNLLYYNTDAAPFVMDLTPETLGEAYEDYRSVIAHPISFLTVKQKCINHRYHEPIHFVDDMNLVFDNCMTYNEYGSSFYKAAKKLKRILHTQVQKRRLMDHQVQVIRNKQNR